MKKCFALLLALCLLCTSVVSITAAEEETLHVEHTIEIAAPTGAGNSGEHLDNPGVQRTTLTAPKVHPGMFMVTYTPEQPLNLSDCKYVEIAMHITGVQAFRQIKFEMELTSSGTCDKQENSYSGFFDNVVEGWNLVRIPLSAFVQKVNGGADLSSINFIRLYSVGTENRTIDSDVIIDFAQFTFSDAGNVNYREYTIEVGKEAALPPEVTMITGKNAGENDFSMFADATSDIVYELKLDSILPSYIYVTMTTGGEDLLLQISPINRSDSYTAIVGVGNTDPRGTYVYDISKYINPYTFITTSTSSKLYLRVADSDPTDGNGGQIRKEMPITISVGYSDWKPNYIEGVEPPIADSEEDEHTVPLFACNFPLDQFKLDYEDKMAGTSSLSYTLGTWTEIDKSTGANVKKTQTGQAGFSFNVDTTVGYDSVDASKMDTLEFWFYVSDKEALAAANFAATGLELTSSGTYDKEEISWTMEDILAQCTQDGWNAIRLQFAKATGSVGEIDLSRISFLRWFFINATNLPEQPLTIKIDNIRMTDYARQEQERLRPIIKEWVSRVESSIASIPKWDKTNAAVVEQYLQHADAWRTLYASLKDEYDALDPTSQSLADGMGVKTQLRLLSQWLRSYDNFDPDELTHSTEQPPKEEVPSIGDDFEHVSELPYDEDITKNDIEHTDDGKQGIRSRLPLIICIVAIFAIGTAITFIEPKNKHR